jgi:hypothetical protein
MAPFPLGRVVATPGSLKLLEEAGEDPFRYLARHRSGDWGDLDLQDRKENKLSLRRGWRIVSSYLIGEMYLDHYRGRQVRHHYPLA